MGSCFQQCYLRLLHKSDNEQHLRHVLACTVVVFFFPLHISVMFPAPDGRYFRGRVCLLHG